MRKWLMVFLFLPSLFFAQENSWQIGVSLPVNRSENNTESQMAEIIQRSIVSILNEVEYYHLESISQAAYEMDEEFLDSARESGYDILIRSYYYVQDDKIYISVSAIDLVYHSVKFRGAYFGSAGIDALETIDSIVLNLKEDLSDEVTPLSDDLIYEYRTQIEYRIGETELAREFITEIGLIGYVNFRSSRDSGEIAPLLAINAYLGRFAFGGEFFVPGLIIYEFNSALAKINLGYSLSSKWLINLDWYLALAVAAFDVRMMQPGISVEYRVSDPLYLQFGLIAINTENSGFGVDAVGFIAKSRWFFRDNIGLGNTFVWTPFHGSSDGGNWKLSASLALRFQFERDGN